MSQSLVQEERPNREKHLSPFWRHYLQMLAVMAVGMVASAAIFLTIVSTDWEQATVLYPTASLLVIAGGMTVPMASWMLYRGMGWRNSSEMAAAMALPVVPFLCLVWFGATTSAQCGAYCLIAVIAMLGLMFYRRRAYSTEMVHH